MLEQHKIQEHRYDISFTGKEKASRIFQSKFSTILRTQIAPIVDKVFDEFCEKDRVFRINRLNIDLGLLSLENFDSNVKSKLEDELRKALRKAKFEVETFPDVQNTTFSKTEHSLELLTHFLLNGTLPWWVHRSKLFSVEYLFAELLKKRKRDTRILLKKIGRSSKVRNRIIAQFTETTLILLVDTLLPSQATYIKEYIEDVKETHEQSPITKASKKTLKEAIWYVVLTYLLEDRGTRFNRKEFLRWNISRLAVKYRVSYEELLIRLDKSVKVVSKKITFKTDFSVLIEEIVKEDVPQKKNIVQTSLDGDTLISFESFLVAGFLAQQEDIHEIWSDIHKKYRKEAFILIRYYAKKESVRKRIVKLLTEKELSQVVMILEPSYSEYILSYIESAAETGNTKKLRTGSKRGFRESVWELVLRYLATASGTRFNKKEFVKSNLYQLSTRYRIKYDTLLNYFYELTTKVKTKERTSDSLPELIQELREEYASDDIALPVNSDQATFSSLIEAKKELQRYIVYGVSTLNKANSMFVLSYILNGPIHVIKDFFKGISFTKESTQRIAWLMDKETFSQFIHTYSLSKGDIVYKSITQILSLVYRDKRPNFKHKRIYFQAIIALVLKRKRTTLKQVIHTIAEVAIKYDKLSPQVIAALFDSIPEIKNLTKAKYNVNKKRDSLERIDFQGVRSLQDFIKKGDRERINELLKFYAYGGKGLFINGKKVPSEKVLLYVYRYHVKDVAVFLNTIINTKDYTGEIEEFYQQSLVIIKRNSGQLAHAQRLRVLINENTETLKKLKNQSVESDEKPESLTEIIQFLEGRRTVIKTEAAFLRTLSVLKGKDKVALKEFILSFIQSGSRLKKWTGTLSEYTLIKLIGVIGDNKIAAYSMLTEWLLEGWKQISKPNIRSAKLIQMKWMMLFGFYSMSHYKRTDTLLVHFVLDKIFEESSYSMLEEVKQKIYIIDHLINDEKVKARKKLRKTFHKVEEEIRGQHKVVDEVQALKEHTSYSSYNENTLRKPDEYTDTVLELNTEPLKRPQFITNAGLVLLSAFLPTYYSRLALLKGKEFSDQKAIYKAIHLLQYLAIGSTDNAEHDLLLNKILCGLPVTESVPRSIELNREELNLSESLLEGVIAQWDVIGNTTIDGFRQSFLKREGKLENEDEFWRLTVEVKGYDMLLDQLPWNISTLLHPWMEKRLHVEWR